MCVQGRRMRPAVMVTSRMRIDLQSGAVFALALAPSFDLREALGSLRFLCAVRPCNFAINPALPELVPRKQDRFSTSQAHYADAT